MMWMLRPGYAAVVLMLASVACGDEVALPRAATPGGATGVPGVTMTPGGDEPAVEATEAAFQTMVAGQAPFRFRAGLSYTQAAQSNTFGSWAIFEPASGTWSEIVPVVPQFHYPWETPTAEQVAGELHVGWIGDDSLRIGTERGDWLLKIDGTVATLGGYDNYDYVDPEKFSRDWAWASTEDVFEIIVAENAGPGPGATTPRYALTAAGAPQWAPDGHTLAFIGNRCSEQRLLLFDADSGVIREAIASGGAGYPLAFDWSTDGEKIALAVSVGRGQRQLLSLDVASGETALLTELETSGWAQPEWSPDGRRVLLGAGAPLVECDFEGAVGPTRSVRLP